MGDLAGFGRAGDVGSLAHYANPAYYWRCYARRKADVSYYRTLAVRAQRVLEYGIGNGRIALPLARAGVEVTGLDLSRPMLADLAARLAREPKRVRQRVKARPGDMRSARLGQRFPLVIAPFNAVLHLYTTRDMERFLARVREHLLPGGEFVFDVLVPSPDDLSRDPSESYRAPSLREPGTGRRLLYRERFEYDPARQLLLVWSEFQAAGQPDAWRVPLTQRQYFPCELEALLHYNGFRNLERVPDFGVTEAHGVDSLVYHCRVEAR